MPICYINYYMSSISFHLIYYIHHHEVLSLGIVTLSFFACNCTPVTAG